MRQIFNQSREIFLKYVAYKKKNKLPLAPSLCLQSFSSNRSGNAELKLPPLLRVLSGLHSDIENKGLDFLCKQTRRCTVNVQAEQTCYHYSNKSLLALKHDRSGHGYTTLKASGISLYTEAFWPLSGGGGCRASALHSLLCSYLKTTARENLHFVSWG